MIKPSVIAALGFLVLVVSGAWAAGLLASPPPDGVYAEADIVITVGETSGLLPVTGAQLGLSIGAGLLLVSVGWALARRSSQTSEELRAATRE
jgi:hypothetical protein